MNRLGLVSFVMFAAAVGGGQGPGVAVAAEPNPSRLAPPKTERPALPSDGSGIYRLNLDQALGAAPLVVLMHVENGSVARAAALPNHMAHAWCPVDASKIALKAGRLTGSLTVECPRPFDPFLHRRVTAEGKPNAKYERYDLKTVLTTTIELDAACEAHGGKGTYQATWRGGEKGQQPFGPWMKRGEKGSISVIREPVRPLPAAYQCDLYLHGAFADVALGKVVPFRPFVFLRVAVEGDKATSAGQAVVVATKQDSEAVSALKFHEAKFTCRDGKVSGHYRAAIDGVADSDFTLKIDGLAVGRRLVGTATVQRGDDATTTQWIGLLHDAIAWPLPLEVKPASWDWRHDADPDARFAERALAESQQPVMPGEPGVFGFWTWRKLTPQLPVSVIHPPNFDLQETKGAAAYRFSIVGKSHEGRPVKKEFTADKPWRPLTPAWKDLPVGTYALEVTALDADGKALPGPMRMGILDKATAKPTTTEVKSIAFVKRPSFAGPYAKVDRSLTETALAMSRWHRAHPGLYERRGIGISSSGNAWTTGGDHGYGVAVADRLWSELANRALTTDVAERLFAEEMLAFEAEDLEIQQRHNKYAGYIHDYQAATPLAYWCGGAILDAYLATGDDRWRAIAMKLGDAIVGQQKENGAFYSPEPDIRDPKTRRGPQGYFAWREGATEFGAAELLYFLGRLRRDLKTDAFVPAETKAYQWVMNHGVKSRFWPINVSHSLNTGYPIWQHPVAALCFSRYLLECAPPERRDVKLAAEVARWAEDVGVDWTRVPLGLRTGPITPRINSIDRFNNDPIAVNMLAAIVFEEVAQATGDSLWSAKAHALAAAVLQGTEPATGRPATNLFPNVEHRATIARGYGDPAHFRHWEFCNGWATQLLREYAALKDAAPAGAK